MQSSKCVKITGADDGANRKKNYFKNTSSLLLLTVEKIETKL
jgi:hypothetical protein